MSILFNIYLTDRFPIYKEIQKIYGINKSAAKHICNALGISLTMTVDKLNKQQLNILRKYIELHYQIKNKVKKYIKKNLEDLITMKSFKGLRHVRGLPVRGQGTHNNRKTQKALSKKNLFNVARLKITKKKIFLNKKRKK